MKIFNCKLCVLLLIFFVFTQCTAFTTEDLDTDLRYIKTCNRTSPISLSTLNEVLINKKLNPIESSSFKCFLHCLFTKYEWMDDDGGFLVHDIKKTLEESDVDIANLEYIIYKCTAIDSVDKCERSFIFTRCFWDKMNLEQPIQDETFYELEEMTKK